MLISNFEFMDLTFAHPQILWILGLALPLIVLFKLKFEKPVVLKYPLTDFLRTKLSSQFIWKKWLLTLLKIIMFGLCIILISRPQWREKINNIKANGIDIILSIDVSESMLLFDDRTMNDRRSRIAVAKEQAIKFINNRIDDQIGVTVFGKDAITLAPLTIDKNMLETVIHSFQVGDIDSNSTNLAEGLGLAISRLSQSTAKSKVVVLLTDGKPNVEGSISIEKAIQLAKDLKVKVYTIGIGSEGEAFAHIPNGQIISTYDSGADMDLLEKISSATGGKCFNAKHPKDIVAAYEQIDKLEKIERTTIQYFNHTDIFWPLMAGILGLLLLILSLQGIIWRGVW